MAALKTKLPHVSPSEAVEFVKLVDTIALNFIGQLDDLEAALGMLCVGRLFGWKVLVLVHNKRTIRKYEDILQIKVREFFPETGPLTHKSVGLEIVQKLDQFWKAVSGDMKLPQRREIKKGR